MGWNDCGRGGRAATDAHNRKLAQIARRGSAGDDSAEDRRTRLAASREIRRIDNQAHRKGWW